MAQLRKLKWLLLWKDQGDEYHVIYEQLSVRQAKKGHNPLY